MFNSLLTLGKPLLEFLIQISKSALLTAISIWAYPFRCSDQNTWSHCQLLSAGSVFKICTKPFAPSTATCHLDWANHYLFWITAITSCFHPCHAILLKQISLAKGLVRLIVQKLKLNHATPLFKQLQWIPNSFVIKPRSFTIVYKALHNLLMPPTQTLNSHLISLNSLFCSLDFIHKISRDLTSYS